MSRRAGLLPDGVPAGAARALLVLGAWAAAAGFAPAAAQATGEPRLPGAPASVRPMHEAALFARVERAVHAALLAGTDEDRDRHLRAAEQLARHLVALDTASADAHYWLAVAMGIKTEHSGPFQKLTSGKEVFFTTARVLELDSLHAGGHELMGRLHAAVMRLPWVVRGLALRMGMGDALGEASWARAEEHYRRAAELDRWALAPRLELAKLYLDRGRSAEALPVLSAMAALPARSEVDRRMKAEAAALLARAGGGAPSAEPPG